MARPKKSEAIAIKKRNLQIVEMSAKYPVEYLSDYFGLTEGRISQILKEAKDKEGP